MKMDERINDHVMIITLDKRTSPWRFLTHWGWLTHICVRKPTIFGSDNGLSPGQCQAIIWTNAGILLFRNLGSNFSEVISKIHTFSFRKMHLKMPSAKWRPFCFSLNLLSGSMIVNRLFLSFLPSLNSRRYDRCASYQNETRQNSWNFVNDICKNIFESKFMHFTDNLEVQLTISQYRSWGDKPLPHSMTTHSSLTHTCVTRPRWVSVNWTSESPHSIYLSCNVNGTYSANTMLNVRWPDNKRPGTPVNNTY